jgi:ribosomal protein S18 acetylase RimI-like enzyme
VLYTQKVLKPAITLYRKNGFTELTEFEKKYARCDTKMEKRINSE